MDHWGMFISVVGVLIALLAVLCPALVYLGIVLGALRASSSSAHKRIDSVEETLLDLPNAIREEMRDAIRDGWKNCPLALKGSAHAPEGDPR